MLKQKCLQMYLKKFISHLTMYRLVPNESENCTPNQI